MTRYTGVRSHGERTEYRKKGQRRKDEMSDDVQEIKSRLDIAEVIGDYLPLKRKGNLLWGFALLSPVEQDIYIKKISGDMGISEIA